MPGKKISKFGSNLYTNNTNVFGSMAGANSTVGVRPNVTGLVGYNKGLNLGALANSSCGRNRSYEDNRLCALGLGKKATILYDPVRNKNILG
jgi:hypothetical protein